MPAPTARSPQVMTVEEVAGQLGVSRMTVYRLIQRGELTGHRYGRLVRVYRTDLSAYIRDSEIGAA